MEECYAAEGQPTDNIPVGVLRFMCISEDRAEIERYVDGARYQQRIAVALRMRQESLSDDYMVEENGFDGEPPLDRIERNILAGNVEYVAERLCEEIEMYGPTHMNIYFQVGDVASATALRSMDALATQVIPLVEKYFGKPMAEINHVPIPTPKPLAMAAE